MNKLPWGLILGGGVAAFIIGAVTFDLSGFEIPPFYWPAFLLWSAAALTYAVIQQGVLVYVAKRLVEAVFVLWVIATLTFLLLRFLPGGPFDEEKALPPEVKANIEREYGLNEPLPTQYANYIVKIAQGDLGESYKYVGRSVADIISETLPVSAQMGFYSLLLAFLIGIPIGIFAANHHNTLWDNFSMIFAISGVALPSFMVGPILVMIFSFGIPISAFAGLLPPALWETPLHYILPVITLGVRPAGIIARMMRSSVLEVIKSDFIRTAHAKGLSETYVLYKHVLKNSLIPVLTISGPLVAGILSGSFVNEIIFAVPGMGKHLIQSVTNRDYPLVMGITLVYAAMLILANLIVDLLYVVVDPRIKLS